MKKLLLLSVLFTLTVSSQVMSKDFYNNTNKGTETVYTDGKNAVSTVYSDAKSIAPEIANNLKGLAKELKVGADYVWTILVKQQKVWSIGFLILCIVSICNWCIFWKRNFAKSKDIEYSILERDIIGDVPNLRYDKYYAEKAEYKNDPKSHVYIKGVVGKEQYNAPKLGHLERTDWQKFLNVIHLCICLAITTFNIFHFGDMLTGFINPEFGAMKNIVEFTTKIK